MQCGRRVTGLQAQRFGELSRRFVRLRALRQHGAQFIVQVGAFRIQIHSSFQFRTRGVQIAAKTGDSSQSAMGFRVRRSQTYRLASFGISFRQISALCQGVGEIDMRLWKIWFQPESGSKLGNGLCRMPLREQDPTQRIVSFGTSGSELNHLFESGACAGEIAALHRRHSLAIE